MKSHWCPVILALALAQMAGCSVYEEYPSYRALREEGPSTIRVMTVDTVLYTFSKYEVLDSVIRGEGSRKVLDVSEDFKGTVPIREIVYVQGREFSFFRTLLATAALGAVIAYAGESQQNNGLRVWRPTPVGSSCPYVYVWDGETWQIQGETFGTAFGRALETNTSCMLPAAAGQDDALRVRLTNERPETHYVNSVHLFSCQAPAGATVLLDVHQHPWALRRLLPPVQAPRELEKKDGNCWMSDLRSTFPHGGFRDTVELTLPMSGSLSEGSLVVHAVNSNLVTAVYDIVFRYLGEQSLPFLYQVETNRELIAKLREWIAECSLTVEVWKDGKWASAGIIPPEADYVPFSKIVRIDASGIHGREMRVRLTTLADVWQIDAVEMDWTATAPLDFSEQPLLRSTHSVTGANTGAIQGEDGMYSVMFPGERIDMTFSHRPASGEGKVFYFLNAGGYLYESLPDPQDNALPVLFASFDTDRVQTVCNLVQHRDAFLGLVYERWRKMRPR